ncbi:hypothetical protein [Psychromicrobium lacuslunae]|uniref:DUF551 domain-containing protein n=1 Tax=Psychromicrobium lacuslunae TaxID=1618207 RepID=A0A0D4C1V8_9MICC|nr:hypothetical protein [Psychromicrobium lacuslunae]AJT42400.1 hypothetical protein UM93_14485 [Psychromicrobium lacuslunae]
MSRPILARDVRPGDTVRENRDIADMAAVFTFPVAKVEPYKNGKWIRLATTRGVIRNYSPDDELTLIDRPAPQLPTEPGSVIIAYEVRGVRNEDGWRMMLTSGEACPWISSQYVDGYPWHDPEHITDWLPATVTTKETEQ